MPDTTHELKVPERLTLHDIIARWLHRTLLMSYTSRQLPVALLDIGNNGNWLLKQRTMNSTLDSGHNAGENNGVTGL